jgi:protein SCO1/2
LLAAGLAAALLALAGCSSPSDGAPVTGVSTSADDGLHGIVLPQAYRVPSVTLKDSHGAPYDVRKRLHKPLTLVFFGYTNCPDICGVVMANIASALTRLDDQQRAKVSMVFVTTDPSRDTAPVLRSYLDRFDPSFEGLTGPIGTITAFGKALGVPIQTGKKLPSGGYDVSHGTQVLGVVPGGRAPVVWTEGTSPGDMADDITTILDHGVPTPPEASGSSS